MQNFVCMLVPSMNIEEIKVQLSKESVKMKTTTMFRLAMEYDRERKKMKVKKEDPYYKEYAVKTTGKNTWLIFMHKAPSKPKYTNATCINCLAVAYYYSDKGLKAFYLAQEQQLVSFNSHFFKRYNERLSLNLSNPVDIVKAFFRKGFYVHLAKVEQDNRQHILAMHKEGITLGEYHTATGHVEWRTFVSKDLLFKSQNKLIMQLRTTLKQTLEDEQKHPEWRKDALQYYKDVYHTTGEKLTA